MSDLIEVFDNAIPSDTCRKLIEIFESNPDVADSRVGEDSVKHNIRRSSGLILTPDNCAGSYAILNTAVQKVFENYKALYPVLTAVNPITPEAFTLVRYSNEDQEYGWHVDAFDYGLRYRFVSLVTYLNTVNEGGETEFRIQNKKISPKEGSVLIFPSGWSHEHRGLPPVSGPKYIITIWLRYGDTPPL